MATLVHRAGLLCAAGAGAGAGAAGPCPGGRAQGLRPLRGGEVAGKWGDAHSDTTLVCLEKTRRGAERLAQSRRGTGGEIGVALGSRARLLALPRFHPAGAAQHFCF